MDTRQRAAISIVLALIVAVTLLPDALDDAAVSLDAATVTEPADEPAGGRRRPNLYDQLDHRARQRRRHQLDHQLDPPAPMSTPAVVATAEPSRISRQLPRHRASRRSPRSRRQPNAAS